MLKVLRDRIIKNKFGLLGALAILVMTVIVLFISNTVVLVSNNSDVEESLHERLGENYYYVYDFSYFDLLGSRIIFTKEDFTLDVPKFNKNKMESFENSISYVSEFSYNQEQSNPNLVAVMGGNCQALSIVFQKVCENNGIECKLDGTADHVYNLVEMGQETYKVDLTNKTVEKIE